MVKPGIDKNRYFRKDEVMMKRIFLIIGLILISSQLFSQTILKPVGSKVDFKLMGEFKKVYAIGMRIISTDSTVLEITGYTNLNPLPIYAGNNKKSVINIGYSNQPNNLTSGTIDLGTIQVLFKKEGTAQLKFQSVTAKKSLTKNVDSVVIGDPVTVAALDTVTFYKVKFEVQ
jgi:hypothetical protein